MTKTMLSGRQYPAEMTGTSQRWERHAVARLFGYLPISGINRKRVALMVARVIECVAII